MHYTFIKIKQCFPISHVLNKAMFVCLFLCIVWPGAVRAPRGDSRQAHTENAGGAGGETNSSSHSDGLGNHRSYWNRRKRFKQEGEGQRTTRGGPGLQQPCCNLQRRAPERPGQSYAQRRSYALPQTYAQSTPALYCSCFCRPGTDVNAFQQSQSEELSIG